MKRFFSRVIRIAKIKKEIKLRLNLMTIDIPCVNLSVKYSAFKGFCFYNNSDLIARLTYDELISIAILGKPCFDLLIYCLCIKNSIDKY